jgi:hypothetical protein
LICSLFVRATSVAPRENFLLSAVPNLSNRLAARLRTELREIVEQSKRRSQALWRIVVQLTSVERVIIQHGGVLPKTAHQKVLQWLEMVLDDSAEYGALVRAWADGRRLFESDEDIQSWQRLLHDVAPVRKVMIFLHAEYDTLQVLVGSDTSARHALWTRAAQSKAVNSVVEQLRRQLEELGRSFRTATYRQALCGQNQRSSALGILPHRKRERTRRQRQQVRRYSQNQQRTSRKTPQWTTKKRKATKKKTQSVRKTRAPLRFDPCGCTV